MLNKLNKNTSVTFVSGSYHEFGEILYAEQSQLPDSEDKTLLVITDVTPFHPLDHNWPDQPGDIGQITIDSVTLPIINSITAAYHVNTSQLAFDKEISVRRGDPEWLFHAVHVVRYSQHVDVAKLVGKTVVLDVDKHYRHSLSVAHTSCHLFALALNKLTKNLWTKETRLDGLGNPNIDQAAIQKSFINPMKSTDIYRFGKSIRKAGFGSEQFLGQLDNLKIEIEEQISQWIDAGFEVKMTAESPSLDSRRYWEANLTDGKARIPCGGTHVHSSQEIEAVSVLFDLNKDESGLTVFTVPR